LLYLHECLHVKKATPQKNEDGLTSDEEDEDDGVDDVDEREGGIATAYKRVENAQKERNLFNLKVEEAQSDTTLMVLHRLPRYCLVADYCQNMTLPQFGGEQHGETYYFSPLGVYCFGMANPTVNKLYPICTWKAKDKREETMSLP
jgi:hypothetical protein